MQKIESLISESLGIHEVSITDDLSYQSISQWDSLGHIRLLLSIEREWDIKIDEKIYFKFDIGFKNKKLSKARG